MAQATAVYSVAPTERPGRPGARVGLVLLLLATIGALAHVGVRMERIRVAYELAKEQRSKKVLEEEQRRLELQIGTLRDPNRVVSIARDKLGLVPPEPEAIRVLDAPANQAGGGKESP